jgi:flagellar biosynthetic protein FliQ
LSGADALTPERSGRFTHLKGRTMTSEMVVQLARRSFETILLLSAPLLGFSLIVGLLVSIFQTVTSINEATLAFVPKIIAVMVAMIIFFPWMMSYITDFTREIFAIIPNMRH